MKVTCPVIASALVLLALAACAAPAAPAQDPTSAAAAPRGTRTLVMGIANEPEVLTAATGISGSIASPIRLFNAGVALKDERGTARPYLAEALPQLDTESWKVFPGGRMETIYRLRPNLTWHDGAPLSAEEFVFAWRILSTPAFGVAGRPPHSQMEEVLAPDVRTVVIRWRRPFPDAATLMTGGDFDFTPLPHHLLDGVFHEDRPESFAIHPYWTRDYIGLGPFRLHRWEPGVSIEGAAFEGHALGRPRIGRIRIISIRDSNTAVSNLLAGEVHVTDETVLTFSQGTFLRREWGARDAGSVLFAPNLLSYAGVQVRPEVANPRALLDVRVRRAAAYAVDKQGLNDGLFEGEGLVADSLIAPQFDYYPMVEHAITRYPYDPRRTEQLITEAGFMRGPDGIFTHPTDGRFAAELRYSDRGGEYATGAPIILQGWQQAGLDAYIFAYPATFQRDGQYRSGYPGFDFTGGGIDESNILHSLSGGFVPRPETRWTGQNRGGWSNAAYDRLISAYDTELAAAERTRQVVEMTRIVSEQVPWIPLYFNLRVIAHLSAVSGPRFGSPGATRFHNVHEWEFR